MLATYAASRHRQIVPCCMISSVSHDNVSRLVTDRSMCFSTALDKAVENIDCMSAILRCQAKNRFYESTQRLIQPRRVLWPQIYDWIMQSRIRRLYDEMRSIESEMESEGQSYDADTLNTKLEELSERANRLSLPTAYASMLYTLRSHIGLVRNYISTRQEQKPH